MCGENPHIFDTIYRRIRALYRRVWVVQAIVLAILFIFIGFNSWLLTRGIRTSILVIAASFLLNLV